MRDRPNYYAVLPATVRYDKRLPPAARLLYAELTALASKEGYAWPSNSYLAQVFDVERRTVIRWIQQLVELGYLTRDASNRRRLYVGAPMPNTAVTQMSLGVDENVTTRGDKNVTHNTTSTNTIMEQEASDPFTGAIHDRWQEYLQWRREELGKGYRSIIGTRRAFERLRTLADGDPVQAAVILEHCMANRYQGIFAPKTFKHDRPQNLRRAVQDADLAGLLD
jgi:hypothetical protein